MTQFARPNSDISVGAWVTAPLHSKISDSSSATTINGSGATGATFTVGLNAITDPISETGYELHFIARRWADLSEGSAGFRLELLEGTTVRDTWNQLGVSRTGLTEYTRVLTAAVANSIGNHANLRLRGTEINVTDDFITLSEAWLQAPDLATPAKVTGVAASDGTYADKVRVTWNSAAGATSYKLYRHTANNFGASTLIYSNIGGTSKDDTTAVAGTVYYYWVVSHNTAGDGTVSSPNTGYRLDVPSAPTGVAASDGTSEDHVEITWTAVSGATSYKVLRDGVVIASGVTAVSYLDTAAVAPTVYSYTVKAVNAAGASTASSANTGYRASPATPPVTTAPTNFAATDGALQGKVRLSWDDYDGALTYDLYRSLTQVFASTPFVEGLTDTVYYDTAVAPGQLYYYRVVAVTVSGDTDPSASDTGFSATQSLRFFQEALKTMLDLGFKGTSSVAGLSATPTIEFEALNDTYEFDPADTGYASIPAGAKTGIEHTYDGTSETEMTADDGALALVDVTMPVDAGSDPARQLLLWSDHGTFEPLICMQDSFVGTPFDVLGGDSPTVQWSRLTEAVFRMANRPAPGVAYPFFLENILYALLGGSARHVLPSAAPTLKINLLSSEATLVAEHRYLSDIPDAWFCISEAGAVSLTSVTTSNVETTAAKVTAADVTFPTPAAGLNDAYYALVYLHNADPDLALLALCWPLANPIVFDSTDIVLQFDALTGIWQLGE